MRGAGRAALAAFAGVAAVAACGSPEGGVRYEFQEPHMGTGVRIVLYADDPAAARSAATAAYAAVARIDSLLSDYRDDSEIAALASEAGSGTLHDPSPELAQVVDSAVVWARRTDGAFDVTVGPLTRLWRWAMRREELPDSARLAAARALVDAGGDLALGRAPPGTEGWRVEFPGGEVHRLSQVAVATSGDRYQYLEVDGVRYSHIVDPRTGLGMPDAPTVAVVARGAVTADVLASALSLLSPEAGRSLVEELGEVAVRWMPRDPGSGTGWETPGFPRPRS